MNREVVFEEEKDNLKKVIDIIEQKIEKSTEGLEEQKHFVIGFKEGMRGTQFNRQAMMSMYATDIYKLSLSLDNPYFGKFVFEGNDAKERQIYIGKRAVMVDGGEVLVYDWRSPICSVYYDYSIGPCEYDNEGKKTKGKLNLKRQFNIKQGELIDFDEVDSLNDDQVLLKYLSENNDARLKSIIATIQKEQNKIIRSSLDNDYIVQGVAGAGKTTVALHRIAYILYNEAKRINENDFMILGPNKYFLNYISELLPDLDIKNVEQTTFETIGLENIGSKMKLESKNQTLQNVLNSSTDVDMIKYKSSLEFMKEIEVFIDKYIRYCLSKPVTYGDDVLCSETLLSRIANKNEKDSYISVANELTKVMGKKIKEEKDTYYDNVAKSLKAELRMYPVGDSRRLEIIKKIEEVKAEIAKGCPNVFKEYFKFLKAKPVDLYIEFINSLNVPEKSKKEIIDRLNKKSLEFEDLTPIMYINYLLNGIDKYKEYTHIVIDEAQDLSLAQYYLLKKMFKNATFDIYGDINQSIYDYNSIHNWDELNERIFNNSCKLEELNKSYRTTKQISDTSNLVLEHIESLNADCIARNGAEIEVNSDVNIPSLLNQIKTLQDENFENIAVICKDDAEAVNIFKNIKKYLPVSLIEEKNEKYYGGICVMPSYLSKGLEFDAVIINDADKTKYEDNAIDMKLLYVAITRAMHKLIVNYSNELPDALKSLDKGNKKLVYTK